MTNEDGQLTVWVCAVCSAMLDVHADFNTGEVSWLHPVRVEPFDHEPEPAVSADGAGVELTCHFCTMPNPMWSWQPREFVTTACEHENPHGCSGPWAACPPCSEWVQVRDLDGLVQSVMHNSTAFNGLHPRKRKDAEELLRAVYAAFFATDPAGPSLIG
ncbi:hypothetical protein ACFHYQ_25515 [Sphaerimonospora cavernae]|uniref:Uncharacterized protein n=1 Tax=Sphaerimonospora cavernae TaxID=1740611 RepID=A0ABV6UBU5_9ACTN